MNDITVDSTTEKLAAAFGVSKSTVANRAKALGFAVGGRNAEQHARLISVLANGKVKSGRPRKPNGAHVVELAMVVAKALRGCPREDRNAVLALAGAILALND